MRGKEIKDERITASLQRFGSQGFQILSILLMISIFIKAFILKWDVELWIDSMLLLLISVCYFLFRSIKDGLYLFPSKKENIKRLKKANYIGGAVGTFVMTGIMLFDDFTVGGEVGITRIILTRLVGAIIFFIGITWSQWFILKLSNKNANKNLE